MKSFQQEIGASIACAHTATEPLTLSGLLLSVDKSDPLGRMLHSTAARICDFLSAQPNELSLQKVMESKEDFVRHLKASKYAAASCKTYRNYFNLLLKKAQGAGWSPRPQTLPPEWEAINTYLPRASTRKIVEFAVRTGKRVEDFCEDDLRAFEQASVDRGTSLTTARAECSRFRAAMSKAPESVKPPRIESLVQRYGVALKNMSLSLRKEVEALVKWKTSDLQFDRPEEAAQIRPISAQLLVDHLCRLAGYGQNVLGQEPYLTIGDLFTAEIVQGYATWAINERGLKGQSLQSGLGIVFAALRYHPKYKLLDLSWFEPTMAQIKPDKDSLIRERKEKKYISFETADQLPFLICAARKKISAKNLKMIAQNAQDELLMKWLIILPWRQRNIRSCRISGPRPNLFKGPIKPFSSMTKPAWIAEREKLAPGSSYWQFRFSSEETKTGNEVHAFLPQELVPLLEAFLTEHRQHLLDDGSATETLFLNFSGKSMTLTQISKRVSTLASRYAGVPTTPHLYRDIVAFEWLSTHPEDYLTLSKLLWHSNINTTIRIYGRRFDESTGVARMDDWRASCKAA